MITNSQRGSAEIIKFPARGRFAAGVDGDVFKAVSSMPESDIASARTATIPVSSGWYHEAAIQDAERGRSH